MDSSFNKLTTEKSPRVATIAEHSAHVAKSRAKRSRCSQTWRRERRTPVCEPGARSRAHKTRGLVCQAFLQTTHMYEHMNVICSYRDKRIDVKAREVVGRIQTVPQGNGL